jgi:acyl-CoA reductase-like NAD-dependent aldehyde dehydrogenase
VNAEIQESMSDTRLSQATSGFLRMGPLCHFVDGKWSNSISGAQRKVINPATEQSIATVAEGAIADVEAAVAAARRSFEGEWRRVTAASREKLLRRVAELIENDRVALREIIVLENGKPLFEADAEVSVAVDSFNYYAGWPSKIYGETFDVPPGQNAFTKRAPVGVCGLITAWNGPIALPAWKIATALACGNTVILKPAEDTPLTSIRLVQLLEQAGIPKGVVNLVLGDGQNVGSPMGTHSEIDKISFTGSTAVGKHLIQSAAGNLKRLSLELGGKSASLVMADADVQLAATHLAHGVFRATGQMCTCASRIFVHSSVVGQFVDQMVAMAQKERLGEGLDPLTTLGPLVSAKQLQRVSSYFDVARGSGLRAVCGGKPASREKGFFVEPTVYLGATNEARIAQEEIFGPVTAILPFDDVNEAIRLANRTIYGLAASVWTKSLSQAHLATTSLRAGTVWVNTYNILEPYRPFGGFKQSGIGREFGPQSIDAFTETKTVFYQH